MLCLQQSITISVYVHVSSIFISYCIPIYVLLNALTFFKHSIPTFTFNGNTLLVCPYFSGYYKRSDRFTNFPFYSSCFSDSLGQNCLNFQWAYHSDKLHVHSDLLICWISSNKHFKQSIQPSELFNTFTLSHANLQPAGCKLVTESHQTHTDGLVDWPRPRALFSFTLKL